MVYSLSEHDASDAQSDKADEVVKLSGICILAYLRRQETGLVQGSLDFLRNLEALWEQHAIDSQLVWEELNERIALSEDLFKRGIRARKGGPYRSTKLP